MSVVARITKIKESIEINYQPLSNNVTLVTQNDNMKEITQINHNIDPQENEKKEHVFRCYCGREFTSLRGLNTHRQSCFVGKTPSRAELYKDTAEETNDWQTDVDDDEKNLIDLIDLPKGEIKKGVFLPNNVQDWENANAFFRINIHHNANIEDVNSEIRDMQNTIDNYFSET